MAELSDTLSINLHQAAQSLWPEADVVAYELVQTLWGGYGHLVRVQARSQSALVPTSFIAKCISWQQVQQDEGGAGSVMAHPRGWGGSRSHGRKKRSYEVETAFYHHWAEQSEARIPECYGSVTTRDGSQIVFLEDLDAAGFSARLSRLDQPGWQACLRWLAQFHANFFGQQPHQLWAQGTYWHLATRPDELAAMDDGPLRDAASYLDRSLADCPWRTLVHGDAKVANFCFAADQTRVAAVDFQYVGGGVGTQDVVYFLGSVFSEDELSANDEIYWRFYTEALRQALQEWQPHVDADAVVSAWSDLYAVAWADFARFMAGWCPDHPKQHAYTQQQVDVALRAL